MARAAKPKKEISMEEALWKSADKLRGSVEPAEYKHVVLSLFFLKFASDKFEECRNKIIATHGEKYADMKPFYTQENVFYLPEESRWKYIIENAKQDDIALKIDTALYTIEKNNPALKGALPDNYYSRLHIDTAKLASLLDEINRINTDDKENDIIGRVYEYFLSKFALAEGKGKGEFYTPKCIVNLIAEMLEPYDGILYDPCCGSGGLLALGCNIWNMAFYGCFLGYFLFWCPMMKKGMSRGKIVGASILGCVVTLQLGAFSVALETLASGITDLPFSVFVATMQPIHLAIGLVEGLITAAVLLFVYEARPEMLSCSEERAKSRFSFKKTIAILGIAALVIGGAVSLAASSNPDGLEWSMERLTGSTELENDGTGAHAAAEEIQEKTALLPDYGFKNSDSTFGTSFSGIAGSAVVLIVCVGACYAFRFFKKKKS